MIHNKKLFTFVILTIFIQGFFVYRSNFLYTKLPFADGIPITTSFAIINRYLLNWYLPIIAISFYISGFIGESLSKYGKFLIVRNYSKKLWLLKQLAQLATTLSFFVFLQFIIFWLGPFTYPPTSPANSFLLIIMYFLTLFTLFLIQILLELYVSPQVGQLILNGYIILSVLLGSGITLFSIPKLVQYLLLPNYGMGLRNGLSGINEFPTLHLNIPLCLILLLSLNVLFMIIAVKRFNRIDIL